MHTLIQITKLSQNMFLYVSAFLCVAIFFEHFVGLNCFFNLASQTVTLRQILLKSHVQVGLHEEKIVYNGRWLSAPNQLGKDAGFGGGNFEFTVFNTTSVFLELANVASVPQDRPVKPDTGKPPALVLVPAKSTTRVQGPVSFLHSVNGSANATYHNEAHGIVNLGHNLDPQAVHGFRVWLPYSHDSEVLQFKGLWLAVGAQLLQPSQAIFEDADNVEEMISDNTTRQLDRRGTMPRRKLIEIMGSTSLLSNRAISQGPAQNFGPWTMDWPSLLEDNFDDSTVSTISIPLTSCLTSRCGRSIPKAQDIFFRAGPPDTTLYTHFWPFASSNSIPYALVLSLGLSDVEAFLYSRQSNKHDLASFTDDFSHQYSSFIQTIRRTAYSPSSLASTRFLGQNLQPDSDVTNLDGSYLYNSAPSTLPIFLVLPPVPSPLLVTRSRTIKAILHHATTKVLDELKWHIGDKHTFLVDTAGWLQDTDLISLYSTTNAQPSSSTDRYASNATDFRLTQSGHIKFAYYMSLHLCAYVGGAGKGEECPFQKYIEYTGNLYVPDAEGVEKILEEKRVAKIEEMFGI